MKFPYPENSADWQSAYTREDAYRESGKHALAADLALLVCAPIVTWLFSILLSPLADVLSAFGQYEKYARLLALLLLAALVVILFMAIQKQALRFALSFFADFYKLPDGLRSINIVTYRLRGKMRLPPPFNMLSQFQYIIVRDGQFPKDDQWPAWMARHLGGPILLIIFDGCALYLERGNRFSRVVGPGDKIPFLEWHERIKYVADLRPKERQGEIQVWSKDGINVTLKIRIECRIGDPKKNPPAASLVYPYDPVAVKKAVERQSVRWPNRLEDKDPSDFFWDDAAWGQVTGIVPNYIGARMLDDLFIADRNGGQLLSPNACRDIFERLNAATNAFGVFVTDFQALEIKLPPDVEERQKEFWKAERQSIATLREGETAAFAIRSQEKARADAQRDLIVAIAEGLEKTAQGKYDEPMLLLLSRMLDDSLEQPLMRAYLAKETIETLEKIKDILK